MRTAQYFNMRATLKKEWQRTNAPCYFCGQATIDYNGAANLPDSLDLQHIISRADCMRMGRPDLIVTPTNCAPSHSRCNRSAGRRALRPSMGETSEDY